MFATQHHYISGQRVITKIYWHRKCILCRYILYIYIHKHTHSNSNTHTCASERSIVQFVGLSVGTSDPFYESPLPARSLSTSPSTPRMHRGSTSTTTNVASMCIFFLLLCLFGHVIRPKCAHPAKNNISALEGEIDRLIQYT